MSQRFGGDDTLISPLLESSTGIPLVLSVKEPRDLLTNDIIGAGFIDYIKNLNDNKDAASAIRTITRAAQLVLIKTASLPEDLIEPSQREKYVVECEKEMNNIVDQTHFESTHPSPDSIPNLTKLVSPLWTVQKKIIFLRSDAMYNTEEQKTRLNRLQGNSEQMLTFLEKHISGPLISPPHLAHLIDGIKFITGVKAGSMVGGCDKEDDMCVLM